jgi:hypothetical protein
MSRVLVISFLCASACAHDHAFDRGEVGAMKNASPAISPWSGPVAHPVADESAEPSPTAIVGRVHEMAVQVLAAGDAGRIAVASGVLAGGGMVLTDARALLVEGPGSPHPAARFAVLTTNGAFAARLVGGDVDAGVAVLELPEAALALEGAPLAEGFPGSGDPLLALRTSQQGQSLVFDVIRFSVERLDAARSQSGQGLPIGFAGAPVFDARSDLAGLLVGANGREIALVPAARLLQILDSVHVPDPQPDDHI